MKFRQKPVVIIGAGGHGRVVLDTCRAAGMRVASFLDSILPGGTEVNECPVFGNNAILEDRAFVQQHQFIVAIGDQRARRDISLLILEKGGVLATAIHPSCIVSPSARIGSGTVLVAGSIVNANAVVGRYCIVNTGATIDHDTVLEDGVQICPGAHLAGSTRCAEQVFVGTGAILAPSVTVGENAIIGAGAVVLQPIAPDVLAAGNPARVIRSA